MAKTARAVRNASRIVFYYDIVCPFAYMTSTIVEDMASRAGATVEWTPVLLGGLYEATSATQGKDGSAMDVMCPAKLKITGEDLHRQLKRRGVPYRSPTVHPQKTVNVMRLLSAIPENSLRATLSHAFYKAYWCEDRDLTDLNFLEQISSSYGVSSKKLLSSETASKKLRLNTSEAVTRGAFGVPSFYVNEKFYYGTDRLFFVERALGVDAHPERLVSPPSSGTATLTFFFDYSSPWSFIGFERVQQLAKDVHPVNLKIEWVPILLGALFKNIGTPNVPAAAMNETKRNYYQKDLVDWCEYSGVEVVFPQAFPLRTVLPLRVTLASGCDPQLIQMLYRAAWQKDQDIGDKEVLAKILGDSSSLIDAATSDAVKAQLFSNTSRAVDAGMCGVPSFQVNGGGPIVWGQDKLNIVADMICGWEDPISKL